jgi:isochorismate pyruvate lyase
MTSSIPGDVASPTSVSVDLRPAPEACRTMAEVRQGVDALDRALVVLLAERQRYMDAAARIKADRDAVHDAARIEDVVAKVKASAEARGLSVDIAEPVWRTLIARCIAYEFEQWDRLRQVRPEAGAA